MKRLPSLELENGSSVGVIGGGPAGSFFSYFVLEIAGRAGVDLSVDVYDSRDFSRSGPAGCNMCGGIVSESLVQALATEGIHLPPTVVQRGIDSYQLHMDVGSVHIETPLREMRIAAVHRGSGPKGVAGSKWSSFDGYLQGLVVEKGAHLVRARVEELSSESGRPSVKIKDGSVREYDLLVIAVGINSNTQRLLQNLALKYRPPVPTKAFISEYYLGEKTIANCLGSSMHVFLLDIPRLEFAAIIPKGDYVTVCLLGRNIDSALVGAFLESPVVRQCFPAGWQASENSCQCWPSMNVAGAVEPFSDRVVFIGDCGVTRLYKDGIGAAYRTAKAAATTAVFNGISAASFREHYLPVCRSISADNALGKLTFGAARMVRKTRFARRAVLRMTEGEQGRLPESRLMSTVLWDTFTGSAPYKEIFLRSLNPRFLTSLLLNMGGGLIESR